MGKASSRLSRQVYRLKCHAKRCTCPENLDREAGGTVYTASSTRGGARVKLKVPLLKRRKKGSDRREWCLNEPSLDSFEVDANTTRMTLLGSEFNSEENTVDCCPPLDEETTELTIMKRGCCSCARGNGPERRGVASHECVCAYMREVRTSWKLIAGNLDHHGELFMSRILSLNPAACHVLTFLRYVPTEHVLGSRKWQHTFGLRSLETIGLLIESLDDVETIQPILASLGRRHICPRRLEDELKVAEESVLWMLEHSLEWQWTPTLASAWRYVLSILRNSILRTDEKLKSVPAKGDLAWTCARWAMQVTPSAKGLVLKANKKQSNLSKKSFFSSLEDLTRPCALDEPTDCSDEAVSAISDLHTNKKLNVAKKPLVRSLSTR